MDLGIGAQVNRGYIRSRADIHRIALDIFDPAGHSPSKTRATITAARISASIRAQAAQIRNQFLI